jgi:hypothetical protein
VINNIELNVTKGFLSAVKEGKPLRFQNEPFSELSAKSPFSRISCGNTYVEVPIETIPEESPSKRLGRVPIPSLLGTSYIAPAPHKPTGAPYKRREDSTPALVGFPVPLLLPGQPTREAVPVEGPEADPLPKYGAEQYTAITRTHPDPLTSSPDILGTIDVRSTTNERANWVPEIIQNYGVFVVGTGSPKDDRCGRFKPNNDDTAGACPNKPDKHKPFVLPIGCSRRECPDDYSRWSHKAARRCENVVNGYLNAKFKNQIATNPDFVPRYLPDHISIHPPRALVVELVRRTKMALADAGIEKSDYHCGREFHRIFQQKYQYEEKKALEVLGLKACASVYHPVRLRKDNADREADLMNDSSRYRAVLDGKNWIKHVKFSVHSHIITDGSFLMEYEEFNEKTGWTYRNHRAIANVENLVKYLLSHAGAVPGRHSIRYLGDYQKLNVEGTIKVETFIPCPECLKEGTRPGDCTYVVGKLIDMEYERDKNRRTQLVKWSWSEIFGKHYIKRARIIPVFRLSPDGEPRIPVEKENGKPVSLPHEFWSKLPPALQAVRRWTQQFSQEEWLMVEKKPVWWV